MTEWLELDRIWRGKLSSLKRRAGFNTSAYREVADAVDAAMEAVREEAYRAGYEEASRHYEGRGVTDGGHWR